MNRSLKEQAEKALGLLRLHGEPKILVLPNVWDVASARLVERAGFKAIASSSAAIANSLGYPDGERISRAEMLAAVKRIAGKVALPVTADLEAGYGSAPEDMAETAKAMIEAGAVGLNLEDGTDDPASPLIETELHASKVRRIREAASALGIHVVINARTDVYLAQEASLAAIGGGQATLAATPPALGSLTFPPSLSITVPSSLLAGMAAAIALLLLRR